MTEVKGRTYWLDLFTGKTWREFLANGGTVSGFRESRCKTVHRMRPGDYLLCYLTGVSRFIGILEVTGEAFEDRSPIWEDDIFPCRVPVRIIAQLTPKTAVPVFELRDRLSMFHDMKSPIAWTGKFRGSPALWRDADAVAVVEAIHEASRNPVERPVDRRRLERRPRPVGSSIGPVTIPDEQDDDADLNDDATDNATDLDDTADSAVATAHTEMQWLLLKLGSDMGLDVWVARNDRSRQFNGRSLDSVPRVRSNLPRQFDDATNRTVALIDVLWLERNSIVAAFEVESTTSIYSGLLRMADLLAMQPNLNIPLFLVAPDERRRKVMEEVNRPTFGRLSPPLSEVCRFIAFSELRDRVRHAGDLVRYLKPNFLDEISESCAID